MHDFYYSRLLGDPTKFQPRLGNRYVEFLMSNVNDQKIIDRKIEEADIKGWVEQEGRSDHIDDARHKALHNRTPYLRLLIGSPEQHQSDAKILSLPISRETFEAVRTAWGLPKELLRMMLSSLPITNEFRANDSLGRSITGIMVRSARSRDWNFCLALAYNEATGVLHGLLNGMQAGEIQMLLQCLQESSQELSDHMLLPIFLLELKVHYFAVLLEKRAAGIEEIEYMTGMRHGFSSNPRRNPVKDTERERLLKDLDFDQITQKLTGLTGTLSFCHMTFTSSLRALEAVTTVRIRLLAGHRTLREVDTRITYLRELIVGSQALGGVLSDRTKAQVQTV